MIITAVEPTKKGRYSVFADGEFVFSVDDETLVLCGVKAGREVTVQQLEAIRQTAEEKKAKQKAMTLLSYKSYTKQGLQKRLAEYVDGEAAEKATERMAELGLIDDEDYARRLAADLIKRKGYGERRVMQEMLRRGVAKQLAEEAISAQSVDTGETLKRIIEKKYLRTLENEGEKGKRRAVNGLLRLGYSYDEINSALKEFEY